MLTLGVPLKDKEKFNFFGQIHLFMFVILMIFLIQITWIFAEKWPTVRVRFVGFNFGHVQLLMFNAFSDQNLAGFKNRGEV